MTKDEAIAEIQDLPSESPAEAHRLCDEIIVEYLRANGAAEIADAVDALRDDCHWWAYA